MQLCLHIKHKANGSIERYKARLISVGFIQTHGWAHKVLKVRRLLDAVVSLQLKTKPTDLLRGIKQDNC